MPFDNCLISKDDIDNQSGNEQYKQAKYNPHAFVIAFHLLISPYPFFSYLRLFYCSLFPEQNPTVLGYLLLRYIWVLP